MPVLPPGTLLQHAHIRRCVRRNGFGNGHFIDFGAGGGHISELLLSLGMTGDAFDLNSSSCNANKARNQAAVSAGRLRVHCSNFIGSSGEPEKANLIISSMVIEHLEEDDVLGFFYTAKERLAENGSIVVIVPGGPQFWGIEDEIAGHKKRYLFDCFRELSQKVGMELSACDGLTYPLSNFLLPVSNRLVANAEAYKTDMSDDEKTILSGDREVAYKTEFPSILGLFLNRVTMFPFDVIQRACSKNPNSMVIFAELKYGNL